MTVEKIINAIRIQYIHHKYHLSNAYIFKHDWESDHFCMSDSGYFYEFEIKMSRGDFANDFKKYKHQLFKSIFVSGAIIQTEKIPHRFYFVVPEGLVKPEEIPSYAGLLYVVDRGTDSCGIRQVKQSPFIHKNIFDLNKTLLDKLYFKAEKLRYDLNAANNQIKILQRKLNDRDNRVQGECLSKVSS